MMTAGNFCDADPKQTEVQTSEWWENFDLFAEAGISLKKKPQKTQKTTTTLGWRKRGWINQVPLGSNSVICDQLVFSKKANQKGPVRTWHFNLPVSTLTLTQIQKHDVLNNHKFQMSKSVLAVNK